MLRLLAITISCIFLMGAQCSNDDLDTMGQLLGTVVAYYADLNGNEDPEPIVPPTPEEIEDAIEIPIEEPEDPVVTDPEYIKEQLKYFGKTNGGRSTLYAAENMRNYPATFELRIQGCLDWTEIPNNGVRWAPNGQGWHVLKQSEVSSRGMGLITAVNCTTKIAFIRYK